nr:MAG TPA_asm: hypothetical protein [Caudoviricetes sp.]
MVRQINRALASWHPYLQVKTINFFFDMED